MARKRQKLDDSGWYDRNNLDHRVEKGGVTAAVMGIGMLSFFIATFAIVYMFWTITPAQITHLHYIGDGDFLDRIWWAFKWSLVSIVPAYFLTIKWISRDETEAAAKIDDYRAAQVAQYKAKVSAHLTPDIKATFDGLTLGTSQGVLYGRGHHGGLQAGQTLKLSPAECCQNMIIMGGIGSGKTTRFINPIMQQILASDASALVFDIKGDFRRELDYIAQRVGRPVKVVGDGGMTLNLFRGATPELASSYLKSCFIASGSAQGDGAFWAETATNYCRNLLSLLQLSRGDYSIAGLAGLVFSQPKTAAAMAEAEARAKSGEMDARERRTFDAVLTYLIDSVGGWDEKIRGNVLATCESVLNPFVNPDLIDAFSVESDKGEADLYDLINNREIYLVNLPRHKFGVGGSRFAYLLIKLRYMTMMSERRSRPELNQSRYVAYLCDEYQAIVDAISDTDFWDKSRSSKTIGILSMQGYSSLVKSVGSHDAAAAIMQNWRQRVYIRTEDQATIEQAQRTLGQIDVEITGKSWNHSDGTNEGWSVTSNSEGGGSATTSGGTSTSDSYGASTNIQQQALYQANDFRTLDENYALFIGNHDGRACDDVLEVAPLYVPD